MAARRDLGRVFAGRRLLAVGSDDKTAAIDIASGSVAHEFERGGVVLSVGVVAERRLPR